MGKTASIVITNWNGKDLLDACLPSVLKAVDTDGESHEIIVVDDGSNDGSPEYVKAKYSSVRLVKMHRNKGYGNSVNVGVRVARNEIIVLLNNDVVVEKNFLRPLLSHFPNSNLFAVGSKILAGGARPLSGGLNIGSFKLGRISISTIKETGHTGRSLPNLFVGMGAYERRKFLELEGYDPIFRPFYYEDVDLCYRAWKRGWKVLYEPASVIYHEHGSTINRANSELYVRLIAKKNYLLLHWKNITDLRIIFSHFLLIPPRLLKALLTRDSELILSHWYALLQVGEVLQKRYREKKHHKLRDEEIMRLLTSLLG